MGRINPNAIREVLGQMQANVNPFCRTALYGKWGTGKTLMASTSYAPLHFFMFDSAGDAVLKSVKEEKDIRVSTYKAAVSNMQGVLDADSIFGGKKSSTPKKPLETVFARFFKELLYLESIGYFNTVNTIVLDSMTTFSDAVMEFVLLSDKKGTIYPAQQHYSPQMERVKKVVQLLNSLPCHIIYIAHETLHTDIDLHIKERSIALTGGMMRLWFPSQMPEIYYLKREKTGPPEVYTQPQGDFIAQTKAGNGILKPIEKPDMTSILSRCGYQAKKITFNLEDNNEEQTD